MKDIFLILLLSTSLLPAQIIISLQGGMNSRTGILSPEGLNPNISWKSAISVLIGIDYFLRKSVAISSNVEYDFYPYDTYRFYGATIPEISVKSSTGDASQIYRVSFEGKFFASSHTPFSLCFVTGASYTVERIGQVRLAMAYLNVPDGEVVFANHFNYYWMHSVGIGSRYFISDELGIDLTGKWYSDYSTLFHVSLNIGLIYVL